MHACVRVCVHAYMCVCAFEHTFVCILQTGSSGICICTVVMSTNKEEQATLLFAEAAATTEGLL